MHLQGGRNIYKGIDGQEKKGKTNSNGEVTFDNVEILSYTVKELDADKGSFKRNKGLTMEITLNENDPDKKYEFTMTQINYGGLEITKTDNNNNTLKEPVGFRLYQYTGKWTMMYQLSDTDGNGYTSSKPGGNSNITLKNDYGEEINTIYTIKPGKYSLYEYKNQNKGYNIQYQGQRYDEGRGAYIGEVTIEAGKITNVNDLTYKYHNPLTDRDEDRAYNINEPFAMIYIEKYVEHLNEQTGEISRMALQGAGFKLRIGNEETGRYINLRNATDSGTTTEFFSDNEGKLRIKRIPVNATYTLYETTFPDGVDPTIQPGYSSKLNAVKIATITVNDKGEIYDTTYALKAQNAASDGVQLVEDLSKMRVDNNNISYRRKRVYEKTTNDNGNGVEAKALLYIINHKYINVSGYVWEDIGADTKNPGNGNSKYKEATSEKDKKLQNITVKLYKKGTSTTKATATTDSAGKYKFNNIMAQDIINGNYYIEFDYSSYVNANSDPEQKLYKPVTPTINAINGSKALTIDVLPKEDELIIKNNLYRAYTGYGENASGTEVQHYNTFSKLFKEFKDNNLNVTDWIYKDSGESIYTLHYINLGIMEMKKPEFTISQNLSKAILKVNEYEYTYIYGEKGDATHYNINDSVKPTVKWQSKTDISAFTQKIYPSCIPTDVNKVNTKLKVEYEIVITNSTNTDIDGYYKEKELIISKWNLKDAWSYERYELSTESKNNGWTQTGGSTAAYNEEIRIEKAGTKKIYITFDVKQSAIENLLKYPDGIVEEFPTTATVTAKHEYTRYDYSWKQSTDTEDTTGRGKTRQIWTYWCVDNINKLGDKNLEGKTHYSVPKTQSDSAPYLALQVNEDKTISGIAFKDVNTRATTHEVVGNGTYEDSGSKKENVISGVIVDLLEKDKKTNAKRYILNKTNETTDETNASVTTNENGKYEFKGIVPGEYYIRFTYGNGDQIIVDGNNSAVYSNKYKSTIASNTSNKGYNWYLYLNDEKFNTAVDNGINDSTDDNNNGIPDWTEKNQQIDYRITNIDTLLKEEITSDTPLISVPVEFTTKNNGNWNEHYAAYDNMNFGIIEKPKIDIKIRKEITNIKITLQNGQTLLVGNPTQNIAYTANLDEEWPTTTNGKKGSNNVKIETDDRYLYGSTLEIRYTLTIENESDVTYLTEDYYKYGKYPTNKAENEATVAVNSLIEYVDPNLKIKVYSDLKEESSDQEYTYSNTLEPKKYEIENLRQTNTNENAYRLTKDNLITKYNIENGYYKTLYEVGNNSEIINNKELTTKNGENRENSTTDLKVVAQRIISSENDNMEYIDYSQVSRITTSINAYSDPTAAPFETEIKAYSEIPTDSAKIRATASTGLDRSMKHIISVTILLIGMAGVIVCVKRIRK